MKPSDYFRKAVMDYLSEKGRGSQKKLAEDAGLTPKHLNDFLGERRPLVEEDQLRLLSVIKENYISFIQRGKNAIDGKISPAEPRPIIIQEAKSGNLEQGDFLPIPLYESGRLSAFSGGMAFDPYEKATDYVLVYIRELEGRTKHKLVAGKVGGDSMIPLIPQNSIVIVDFDDRKFVDKKIYAVNDNGGGVDTAQIKRVRKVDRHKSFLLFSENDLYPPIMSNMDWDRLCIGRVVWMWRSLLDC